jgi:hypothetical protein
MYKRALVAHVEDGRWTWDETGSPQPFEQLDRYGAPLIKDRFDRPLLVQYLSALGIHVDEQADGAPRDSMSFDRIVEACNDRFDAF